MAKLITLDGAPESFELTIATKNLRGADVEVTFNCIGRTLRDWHPLAIKRMAVDANDAIDAAEKSEEAQGKKLAEGVKAVRFTASDAEIQEIVSKGLGRMAEVIAEVADGWALDDAFTPERLETLCSKFPGVHQQLWQAYDSRIRGDRLGN